MRFSWRRGIFVSWTPSRARRDHDLSPRKFGRTDEGRKEATDGRKDNVND